MLTLLNCQVLASPSKDCLFNAPRDSPLLLVGVEALDLPHHTDASSCLWSLLEDNRRVDTMVPLQSLPLSLTPLSTPQPQELSPHMCHRLCLRDCGLGKRKRVLVCEVVHVRGGGYVHLCVIVYGVVYV